LKKKKIRPKHLARNISKSWWRPFLSHIEVFFVLNQCRILFFTIIIPENSLCVISCFGFEEKQKIRPKHLARNISKSWWRPFLSHIVVFYVLNQCSILYFTIFLPENSLYVIVSIGFEEKQKKCPNHLARNISKSWWRPFLSHIMIFFRWTQCRIPYFPIISPENSLYVIGCFGFK
jgi:L-rhamnose mutarotase